MLDKMHLFGKQNDPQTAQKPATPGVRKPAEPAPAPARAEPAPPAVATPAKAADKSEDFQGSKLTVGPGVKLKGAEIADCGTLVVEGRVEAVVDSQAIQIAAQGSFSGNVVIDVAEIQGRFDGDLTARKRLVIHSTGRVSGKIRYGKIVIEEGGELSGDVRSLASEQVVAAPVSAAPDEARRPELVSADLAVARARSVFSK
ncbi:MAG: cell shape determination protein CcmA [Rhodocyclaceae bacterium]|nr:cell shape determination protein CcmA [Rhodocyclaceae bacterium]